MQEETEPLRCISCQLQRRIIAPANRRIFAPTLTGAEELKKRFPMLRVKIYDAETKTTEEFQLPKLKCNPQAAP